MQFSDDFVFDSKPISKDRTLTRVGVSASREVEEIFEYPHYGFGLVEIFYVLENLGKSLF